MLALTPLHKQSSLQGLDGAVVLSNSVYLAEGTRLQAGLELRSLGGAAAGAGGSGAPANNIAVGRLMVVKAYLGRTSPDMANISNK